MHNGDEPPKDWALLRFEGDTSLRNTASFVRICLVQDKPVKNANTSRYLWYSVTRRYRRKREVWQVSFLALSQQAKMNGKVHHQQDVCIRVEFRLGHRLASLRLFLFISSGNTSGSAPLDRPRPLCASHCSSTYHLRLRYEFAAASINKQHQETELYNAGVVFTGYLR